MGSMTESERDVRFGALPRDVQDESGVDLLQLKKQLKLSVEERLLNLERQIEFARELRGSARR